MIQRGIPAIGINRRRGIKMRDEFLMNEEGPLQKGGDRLAASSPSILKLLRAGAAQHEGQFGMGIFEMLFDGSW